MDTIILIMICLIFFLMGFSLGWHAREKAAERIVNKLMDQFDKEQEELETNVIKISIEKHNNTYYVYDKEKNSFMGQASNRKELEDVLAQRFPDKRFLADSDNLKEVGFK
jgi:hypothetical protein